MGSIEQSWLAIQCKMIAGVSRAVLLVQAPGQQSMHTAATWPEGEADASISSPDPGGDLTSAATETLAAGHARVQLQHDEARPEQTRDIITYPLLIHGRAFGVVAMELTRRSDPEQQGVIHLLRWSTAWLETLLQKPALAAQDDRALVNLVELVAAAVEQPRFQAAATAVATELAQRLDCERVSIGLRHGNGMRVMAISHNADFDARTRLARQLAEAMDEALDQDDCVLEPPLAGSDAPCHPAHQALVDAGAGPQLCSVPFSLQRRVIGVISLERTATKPFDAATVELCRHVAALVGPILDAKHHEDRWLGRKIWDSFISNLKKLTGPGHLLMKTGASTLLVLVLLGSFIHGDYRVTARAGLEGAIQRTVVSPMEGFIASAEVRAGDIVSAGQRMGSLDDKDMRLEQLRWQNQKAQLSKEYRGALASHDRAQVSILSAQVAQADAQLALLTEQLARTELTAPFDGIVVSGDWSQSLGSPVERGEILFEVAPLDQYRVILQVNEQEIGALQPGQQGRLALAALPGETLAFHVEKITPVATAEDGRNFFRVEAQLQDSAQGTAGEIHEHLRPGMQGVGKVDIGERRLVWIWTHNTLDWLRLKLWALWP